MFPQVRLDEQRVQFRTAVGARHHSGKAQDDAVAFCDEDATRAICSIGSAIASGFARRVAIPGIADDARHHDSSIV
jgi:hypothetical protein